jgi:hypothetical protein
VHSVRLEHWGRGLAACSGKVVVVHWVKVLVADTSASRSSGATHGNSVAVSGMEDADPAPMGEPCLGF